MSKAKKFKDLIKKKAQPDGGKEATRGEWVADVADLFEAISDWMKEEEIDHQVHPTSLTDDRLGQYDSSMLVIMHGDYEATIMPVYTAPRGLPSGVSIKAGKKSGGKSRRLVIDRSDIAKTQWKVPVGPSPSAAIGKRLTKDRFFEVLISIFNLEE